LRIAKTIETIDTHTMGQPTRIIKSGVINIPGATMAEKKQFLISHKDDIRRTLMHEPRGHKDMFGAIYTRPCHPEAHFGVIFMDGGGYLNMCGHGTIGSVTASIATGATAITGEYTKVNIDTPAGLVKTTARVRNDIVEEVSVLNVPSFLYKQNVEVNIPSLGNIKLDIAFGGSFFALIDVKEIRYAVKPENVTQLTNLGMEIMENINRQVDMQHPELTHIKTCDLVKFYGAPEDPSAQCKSTVVFGKGQIDRSPCGTGTSAKLAAMYAKGMIDINETFINESIIGTLFRGKITETCKVGKYDAVIPEITGSAFITGFNTFVFDNRDPVRGGFVL